MKKIQKSLLIVLVSLSCGAVAFAQEAGNTNPAAAGHQRQMKDHVMMRDGKLMMLKDGKRSEMTEDLTLKNGTVIMKDGTVKMADGKTVKMTNGDFMDMDGNLKHHEMRSNGAGIGEMKQ